MASTPFSHPFSPAEPCPPSGWHALSPDQQLALSRGALRNAAELIAGQAELLACEIEVGGLADHGGPDALRLLATLVRLANGEDEPAAPTQSELKLAALPPAGRA